MFCSSPTLPAGVDDDASANVALAVSRLNRDADRALAFEQDLEHSRTFVHVHAVLARVVEHHLVEFAAHDLPGLRALVRLVVPEVERRRQLAGRVDELDAVFLDEVAVLHFGQHVQPPQHPIGFGDQRFADVETGEVLAFEQRDVETLVGKQVSIPSTPPVRRR